MEIINKEEEVIVKDLSAGQEVEAAPVEAPADLTTLEELQAYHDHKLAEFQKGDEELMKKAYVVSLTDKGLEKMISFYETEVAWEYNQSVGIVEVMKSLKALSAGDSKKLKMKGLTIQAIAFHLSKHKGVGHAAALDFLENLLKPMNEALKMVNHDANLVNEIRNELDLITQYLAAVEQGIPVEKSSKQKEFEAKLAAK